MLRGVALGHLSVREVLRRIAMGHLSVRKVLRRVAVSVREILGDLKCWVIC